MICIPVLPLGRSICVQASEVVSSSAALPLTDCGHRASNMQTPAPVRPQPLLFAEMRWLLVTGTGQVNVQHVARGCLKPSALAVLPSSSSGSSKTKNRPFHRIVDWFGLEVTLKIIYFQPRLPCHRQEHLPLNQVAQRPIPPSLEKVQG